MTDIQRLARRGASSGHVVLNPVSHSVFSMPNTPPFGNIKARGLSIWQPFFVRYGVSGCRSRRWDRIREAVQRASNTASTLSWPAILRRMSPMGPYLCPGRAIRDGGTELLASAWPWDRREELSIEIIAKHYCIHDICQRYYRKGHHCSHQEIM